MKPNIFFSHSSRDKKILQRLKQLFLQKTGESVNVFLSSDGQSIPLGRNWVHSIEESLEEAKLMFVFLTPNSVKSDWVYFESGFAYSKGIRVIPVGLLGVHLEKLEPPISLLQGFNINSTESLNNLIAITNKEFDFNHQAKFTNKDYQTILQSSSSSGNLLSSNLIFLDSILVDLGDKFYFENENQKVLSQIAQYFEESEIEHQFLGESLHTHGISFSESNIVNAGLNINLDPTVLSETYSLFENAIQNVKTDGFKDVRLSFNFKDSIKSLTETQKITARFFNSEIELEKDGYYRYKDLKFTFHFSKTMGEMGYEKDFSGMNGFIETADFPIDQIRNLIEFLFDREILFVE